MNRARSKALTCSNCLRGQHTQCSVPTTCACLECYPDEKPPIVQWEDPPPARTSWAPNSEAMAELKEHPKRWGMIQEFPKPTTAQNKLTFLRKTYAEYEFVARRIRAGDERKSKLFARFMGEEG